MLTLDLVADAATERLVLGSVRVAILLSSIAMPFFGVAYLVLVSRGIEKPGFKLARWAAVPGTIMVVVLTGNGVLRGMGAAGVPFGGMETLVPVTDPTGLCEVEVPDDWSEVMFPELSDEAILSLGNRERRETMCVVLPPSSWQRESFEVFRARCFDGYAAALPRAKFEQQDERMVGARRAVTREFTLKHRLLGPEVMRFFATCVEGTHSHYFIAQFAPDRFHRPARGRFHRILSTFREGPAVVAGREFPPPAGSGPAGRAAPAVFPGLRSLPRVAP